MPHTRNKEIGRRLSVEGFITHVHEILARLLRRPKIDHSAFGDHANLVKQVVQLFSRLVKGYNCRKPADIRANAKCLNKF